MGMAESARYIAERLNAATQLVGTASVAASETVRTDGLPILGMIQGFFGAGNGLATLLGNDGWYTPAEKRMRGILQLASGAILCEGGFEATFHQGNTLASMGLMWRYAFHFLSEFILAWVELKACERINISGSSDSNYNQRKKLIQRHMLGTGLAAVGWMILAWTADIANMKGLVVLAASTVCFALRDAPRFVSFLSKKCERDSSSASNASSGPVSQRKLRV